MRAEAAGAEENGMSESRNVTVNITSTCIAQGEPGEANRCPAALAVEMSSRDKWPVAVACVDGKSVNVVFEDDIDGVWVARTPPELKEFIRAFDSRYKEDPDPMKVDLEFMRVGGLRREE